MMRLSRLATWIRYGPVGDENIVLYGVAFLIWWRQLALLSLILVGLSLSIYGALAIGPGVTPFAFLLGVIVGGWSLRLSPKYDVRKHY